MPKPQKQDFTQLFRQIQVMFSRYYANILGKRDLTLPQYTLLSVLLQGGPMPMSEAGSKLHISKPAVTHLTDQLERKKYLTRQAHPHDRRVITLKILPKGERKAKETQSDILKIMLKVLDHFNEDEQKTITSFYQHLFRSVENLLGGEP